MDKEVQTIRVVPYVKTSIKERKEKKYISYEDNLTSEEIRKMSADSKIFELVEDGVYELYDSPLVFKGHKLRLRLCYKFDELTPEEQEKYFDRSEVITILAKEKKQDEVKMAPKKKVRERK